MTEALALGARMLTVAGQTAESRTIEEMLREVTAKTAESTARANVATGQSVRDASEAIAKVATDARTAIIEADRQSRQELTAAVGAAKTEMVGEMRRLVGGENPELL